MKEYHYVVLGNYNTGFKVFLVIVSVTPECSVVLRVKKKDKIKKEKNDES